MKRGASAGVIQRFLAFLNEHSLVGSAVGIGFSGGRDSTALAICSAEAARAGRLLPVLIHVDHGVRADSHRDRVVVQRAAEALGLEIEIDVIESLDPYATEAEMREARYGALIECLSRHQLGAVLTGHHARDQAETVLLHLARGQGAEGASGMAPVEQLIFEGTALTVVRPFLQESPQDLAALVAEFELETVEDPTNAYLDRARNLVRHEVIPALESINPGATLHVARFAEVTRTEHEWFERLAHERLAELALGPDLDGSALVTEPVALQRRVIRAWVEQSTGLILSFDRTEALRTLALEGTGGVAIELGEGWLARQARRRVTLVRND